MSSEGSGSGRLVSLAPVLALSALAGCGGESTAPADDSERIRGFIVVTISTAGVEIDADGYTVEVFGGAGSQSQAINVNETVIFSNLEPDSYFVELIGVASNCELSGRRLRELLVEVGDTTRTTFDVTCFSSSPLANQIVFSTNRDAGTPEIYVMNLDGTGLFNISRDTAATDLTPAVAPDGSQIAYSTDRDGNFEIYLMNASGTGKTRLSADPLIDEAPTWAPDGSAIAFLRESSNEWRIVIAEFDLFPPARPASFLPVRDRSIGWSPEGTKMAVASSFTLSGLADIFVVDTARNEVNLTDHPAEDREPAWSPDGSKIAFVSERDGNPEIYVINADGTGVTRLTDHPNDDGAPSWSPDGARIAFETNRDGNFEIYLMNDDGTGLVNLSNHPADDRDPGWSP